MDEFPGLLTALKAVATIVLSAVTAPIVIALTVLAAFVYLPLPAALPRTKVLTAATQVSRVYDASGHLIAQFGGFTRRLPVPESAIPADVKDAVVASEDRSFYQEGGVSFRGTLRALWADINGEPVQGGSTITQQYVKQNYTHGSRTVFRKVREAVLANQLSRTQSKAKILYDYLSTSYFGEGASGVGAAAEEYFREPVSRLNPSQAATLAGVLPAPSSYDPLVNLGLAEQRRQTVLGLMLAQGYLSQDSYNRAMAEQLALPDQVTPGVPVTTVYPPLPTTVKYPYFVQYVKDYLAEHLSAKQMAAGGLSIQTTLDPTMQAEAQAQVAKSLAGTKPPLQMALASVQPSSGYVQAMVGGRDFKYSQVNLALGGCPGTSVRPGDTLVVKPSCATTPVPTGGGEGRQAGSAFKPFTLATALTEGLSPSKVYFGPVVYNVPNCVPSPPVNNCQIRNAGDGEGGSSYSITQATWYSINTVYAQIIGDVGIKQTAETAKRMGITSANYQTGPEGDGLSYTLGVIGVSPLDMASAYATFADQGVHIPPSPVVRVVDSAGHVVYDDSHPHGTRVLSKAVAGAVTNILEGVLTQPGATAAGKALKRPAAGKTGTTDNYVDGWFVGYTPALSTAVWMGYENNESTPLVNIDGVPRVYGGTIPAQTWHNFMIQALAKVPPTGFAKPPPLPSSPESLAAIQFGGFLPPPQMTPDSTSDSVPGSPPPPPPVASVPFPPTTSPGASTSTGGPGVPGNGGTSTTLFPSSGTTLPGATSTTSTTTGVAPVP